MITSTNLQVAKELYLIVWKSVDCCIVSLHEVDTPLKLLLDHTQWVLLVILI